MTRQDTVRMFAAIAVLFPRDATFAKANREMVELWHEMLTDLPAEIAMAAVKAHAAVSPFVPGISEIRAKAAEIMQPSINITAEEAWSYAIKAVRRYGQHHWKDAERSMPPEVAAFTARWFREICLCEKLDVIRGQFMKAWEMHICRTKEEAAMIPEVKRMVEALAAKITPQLGQGA